MFRPKQKKAPVCGWRFLAKEVISHATRQPRPPLGLASRTVITTLGPVGGLFNRFTDNAQQVFRLEASPLLLLDALVS